ncbi:MAG: hypothetical protein JWP87_6268, partial [Labilithrix sp.]|nr:hypothetical protein [Labilithrix sp.]
QTRPEDDCPCRSSIEGSHAETSFVPFRVHRADQRPLRKGPKRNEVIARVTRFGGEARPSRSRRCTGSISWAMRPGQISAWSRSRRAQSLPAVRVAAHFAAGRVARREPQWPRPFWRPHSTSSSLVVRGVIERRARAARKAPHRKLEPAPPHEHGRGATCWFIRRLPRRDDLILPAPRPLPISTVASRDRRATPSRPDSSPPSSPDTAPHPPATRSPPRCTHSARPRPLPPR